MRSYNLDDIEKSIYDFYLSFKSFLKPIVFVFVIYSVAMISIWRSDVSFIDDMGRAMQGYAWSHSFNRYASSIIYYILQLNRVLIDISPFGQIIAMLLLSISSVIITYIFLDKKIEYLPLLLSTFVGLNWFNAALWLYKFDSLTMAFSILVSVVPFLFWDEEYRNNSKTWLRYVLLGFCVFLMMATYQASSGIFLLMILGLAFKDYLDRSNLWHTLKKISYYGSAYVVSGAVFVFLLPKPKGYRSVKYGLDAVLDNTFNILKAIQNGLNNESRVLLIGILIVFLASLFAFSKEKIFSKRFLDVIMGSLFVVFSIPISYGAYLVLVDAPTNARSIVGFGLILSIISILTVRNMDKIRYKIFLLPSILLLQMFVIFLFGLGNALADQERHGLYRTEHLISDLSEIYAESNSETILQIQGDVGLSPVAKHLASQYPITKSIISVQQYGLGDRYWSSRKLTHYYNMPQKYYGTWREKWDCSNWDIEKEDYYHVIKSKKEKNRIKVCVKVK